MKNQIANSVRRGVFAVALATGVIRFCSAAETVRVRGLGGYVGERMRACYETAVKGEDIPTIVGIFKVRDGTLTLNLYAPATVDFELGCGKGALRVDTEWPRKGEVRLTLSADRPMDFALRLRVPGEGRYREVRRTWKPGETVVENLPLAVSMVEQDGCIAFLRGPVVFARDVRLADGDIRDAVWFGGRQPVVREVAPPAFARQAIEADLSLGSNHANPEERRTRKVRLVDFASAGNTWNADSRYQVWLRKTFDPKK